MLKHAALLSVLFITESLSVVFASPIEFDFRAASIEALDGQSTLSLSFGGLTLNASANTGVLNRTSSGFGINAAGSGDDTDMLDGGSGIAEAIDIRFDLDVLLDSFSVSAFGTLDRGRYTIDGTAVEFAMTGEQSLGLALLSAGSSLSIGFIDGNGFSLDRVTVRRATVTESSSLALLCLGLAAFSAAPGRTGIRRRGTGTGATPA